MCSDAPTGHRFTGRPVPQSRKVLGLLALALFASGPAVRASCMESVVEAQSSTHAVERFVSERLSYWMKHLDLNDWRVSIVLSKRSDLKPKTLGGIRWDKKKKTAVISVLAPSEYRLPFDEMLSDLELTIVHELVHLELASLPRSEASRKSEEHAVNRLSEALLQLNRREERATREVACSSR